MNVLERSALVLALQAKGLQRLSEPVMADDFYTLFGSKAMPLTPESIEFKARLLNIGRPRVLPRLIGRKKKRRPAEADGGGGSGLGRRIRTVERLRCPAGTVNGGRFSNRGLAGCGGPIKNERNRSGAAARRNAVRSVAGAGNLSGVKKRRTSLLTDSGRGNAIIINRGRRGGRAVQISRTARIKKD